MTQVARVPDRAPIALRRPLVSDPVAVQRLRRDSDERQQVLRENIAALTDELFADHMQRFELLWDCPSCAQVERILGRYEEESA